MIKEITHNNQTVIFNPQYHSYHIKGTDQKLTGVTTFIKRFFPKFDTEQVAKDVGAQRGVCPNELKREWKAKSTQSILDGNLIHEYAEYLFGNGEIVTSSNERTENLMQQLHNVGFELINQDYVPVETEKIIFSADLGFSGTIDLLMLKKEPLKDVKNVILIIDFKTSENITVCNPFQNAFKPINHLEDANLTHYSLQLNLYEYILKSEKYYGEDVVFKKIIIHLTETDYVPYVCKDMKEDIESMLI